MRPTGQIVARQIHPTANPEPNDGDPSALDPAICWQAIHSRDRRFDGRFFAAATSTGLYCRSICPVPFAKPSNIILFACAAAAEAAGFKPCRRCHPQASPGTPAWLGTSAVVSRALRLIWDGALDKNRVEELAGRVGIGSRHLRRLFVQHLGASPIQIAGTHRVHFARKLIDETDLPMTQVALSAGFMSIRQFNHSIKGATGQAPTELRGSRDSLEVAGHQKGLTIRLSYRPPFDWAALIGFLRERATSHVEVITDACYQRTIDVEGAAGTITVTLDDVECRLIVSVELPDYRSLMIVVERIKRIFDLGADPLQIASGLSRDPLMRSAIESNAGLRMPGVWDGFELGVKVILGERLMASSSSSLLRKLIQRFGQPIETSITGLTHLFPKPGVLAGADLRQAGLPPQQEAAIRKWSALVSKGRLTFEAPTTLDDTISRLLEIPTLTSLTAHYIALRAFGEPDAFPVESSAIRQFMERLAVRGGGAEKLWDCGEWRPWRAYAAIHMWAARRDASRPQRVARSAPTTNRRSQGLLK